MQIITRNRGQSLETALPARVVPLFELQYIPGKGIGMISRVPIGPGNTIHTETPLFACYPNVQKDDIFQHQLPLITIMRTLLAMPSEKREIFMNLYTPKDVPPIEECGYNAFMKYWANRIIWIFRINALNLDRYDRRKAVEANPNPGEADPEPELMETLGVFKTFSRVNHDCSPNAIFVWDTETEVLELRAVRTINRNSEITVSYISPCQSWSERSRLLTARYQFDCRCTACNPQNRGISDQRRGEMKFVENRNISQVADQMRDSPRTLLRIYKELVKSMEEEGLYEKMWKVYLLASVLHLTHGDASRGSAFMRRALKWAKLFDREERLCDNYMQIIENPSRCNIFKVNSGRWSNLLQRLLGKKVEEGDKNFEHWLWYRAEYY